MISVRIDELTNTVYREALQTEPFPGILTTVTRYPVIVEVTLLKTINISTLNFAYFERLFSSQWISIDPTFVTLVNISNSS